jgi:dolichol-phosphate mannosyltransferase
MINLPSINSESDKLGNVLKSIQIITSSLNEERNIAELISRIRAVFTVETEYQWELLIFDNASKDGTWQVICENAKTDPRVRGFLMSKTFTLDASMSAGIDFATSDVVITMASDLQDEPERIPDFLRKWEAGAEIVFGRVTRREGLNWRFKVLTPVYYTISSWISDGTLHKNVSDFRLMSRKAYEAVKLLQERHRYLRGITSWVGFPVAFVEITRPPRKFGKSNNRIFQVINLALRGMLAQTDKLISLVTIFGIFFPLVALSIFVILFLTWLLSGVPFAGFGTIISLFLILFSLLFFCVGVLAQYIALIYGDVRNRPTYLVYKTTEEVD